MSERNVRSAAISVAFLIAILGVTLHAFLGQSWESTSGWAIGNDDAYITYRYAQNFFNGQGLVYNPGEYVEGYSNLLYTLLIVPVFFFSPDYAYTYSIILNCIFFAGTLYIFFNLLDKNTDRQRAILGTILLASSPYMWANAATGLETILFIFLVVACWTTLEKYFTTRNRGSFYVLLLISLTIILARVDGFIIPLIIASYYFLKGYYSDALKLLLFVVLVLGMYTLARLYIYDDVIANTYYAKVSGSILARLTVGIEYLYWNLLRTGLWVSLIVILIVLARTRRLKDLIQHVDFATFFFLSWLAYMLLIGGDVNYERFLIVAFPMGIYIVMMALPTVRHWRQFVLLLLLGLFIQSVFVFFDGRFKYRVNKYDGWITLGRFLGERYPSATIAVASAGKIPYFSGLRTLDMLGLNDKHIAKMEVDSKSFDYGMEKHDPNYVLGKAPDLISAWMDADLNMEWGLTRSVYEPRYSIKYLVNLGRKDLRDKNIIDVSNMDQNAIKRIISSRPQYGFAVLEKRM